MNQNKGFYRTIVISNLALSILILLYLFTSCFISVDCDSATIGIVVGVTATFIGVCTTLMLGAQIYTVYRSSQSEKELHKVQRSPRKIWKVPWPNGCKSQWNSISLKWNGTNKIWQQWFIGNSSL